MIYVVFFLKAEEHNEVDNELANRMSLFYANATPMLKTLSDATTKFVSKVGDCISIEFKGLSESNSFIYTNIIHGNQYNYSFTQELNCITFSVL